MSRIPEVDQEPDSWESDFWSRESVTDETGSDTVVANQQFDSYAAESDEAPASAFMYDEDSVDDIKRYYDVNRYHETKKHKRRFKGALIAGLVLLVLIVGVAVAVGIYVGNINTKLTENVTTDLREQLAETTPGEPFYLLLLGVDKDEGRMADTENYGTDDHAYRSDSIMLCRIDPKNVKVTMVSIHRDTLINMDSHGQQKINAAYAFGGAAYATQVVSTFADVPISHYAEVDLDRFISIVDQVGGVTVNLPVPVKDPEYTGLDLPAGEQSLDGYTAAMLCRCRHGYDEYGDGDVFRAANQRMIFSAVIKKVLKSDPATIATTVGAMADSVTTDMDVASILELATQMQNLNVETDISTGMEPTDGALINGTWYEICLVDQWRTMMTRVHRGETPYDEASGQHDSTEGIAGNVSKNNASSASGSDASSASSAADAAPAETPNPEETPAETPNPEEAPAQDAAPAEAPTEEYVES